MSTVGIVLIAVGSAIVGAVGGFFACVGLVLYISKINALYPKE